MERRTMNLILLTAILQLAMLFTATAQQTNEGDVVKSYKDKQVVKRLKKLEDKDPVKHIEREEKFLERELTPADTIPESIPMITKKQDLIRLTPEEIAEQFPECLITDHLGNQHIDYTSVISVLFEALIEQNEVIDKLQKRVEELESKLNK